MNCVCNVKHDPLCTAATASQKNEAYKAQLQGVSLDDWTHAQKTQETQPVKEQWKDVGPTRRAELPAVRNAILKASIPELDQVAFIAGWLACVESR